MFSVFKFVSAVVAGIVSGGVVVATLEGMSHMLYPPPPGLDANDLDSIAKFLGEIRWEAKLVVVVAWAAGSYVGGCVAATMSGQLLPAAVVGFIQLAFTAFNLYVIPHPVWMTVMGIVACPLFAVFGGVSMIYPKPKED